MRLTTYRRSRMRLASSSSLGILALSLSAVPVLSQPQPQTPPVKTTPAAPTKTTVLGGFTLEGGDVLAVVVANHPEMSGELAVTEAGKISLPVIGNLTVKGKTIAQAEKIIFSAIDTQLNKPQVTVTLARATPRQVLMVGAVKSSGSLDLSSNWRVSEAIDAAGGLSSDAEDIVATLVRGKAQPIPLSLAKILASPTDAANLTLKPGDVLKFNVLPGRTITVAGDVKTPATFVLRRGARLQDALVAAGGLSQKPETTKITLIRGRQEVPLDAVLAYEQRGSAANAPLLNRDLIMVQAIRTTVSVVALDNQVKNSGTLSMEGQPRVLQAVLAAGLAVAPSQVEVAIQRGSEKIPVDLDRAAYDPSANVPLQNSDVLLFTRPPGPTVRVTGGVTKPGLINLKEEATLLDAIFAAGNLSAKPDEVKIRILRQINGRQLVLDADPVPLISLRDLTQNARLKDGDLVMVSPVQINTVFIGGEVTNPASYQIGENDGLVELLLRAGGPTSFAALKQVQIKHRDNTSTTLDLSQATQPGAARVLVPLQPGDFISVPRNTNQVLIMNAVQRPGYYPIPENGTLTIGNALLMAVPRDRAKLQNVAIVRRGPNGEMKPQIVPVNQLASSKTIGGVLPMNVPLQPGDIVYVPEGSTKAPALQTALGALSSLSVLRNLIGY